MKTMWNIAVVLLAIVTVNAMADDIVWVSIDDPGVLGHGGFTGYMSKYETTNAQYCEFLNATLASGDIIVDGDLVKGADGSNSGADFVDEVYYDLAGPGFTYDGASSGGAARIDYSGGLFTVDSGFENHPVSYVTWHGSTAFCNYYGYRLPTEWEWQAVGDYDGSFVYGCGATIDNSKANYLGSTHPDGTTVVGSFGTYGYGMCDMAGNMWEWASNIHSGSFPAIRGGSWVNNDSDCTVSIRHGHDPLTPSPDIGFRACRDRIEMTWVFIDDDPGVAGHEGFTGYMSKYETTNAQYCAFLNAALADGLITVDGDIVYAASDTGHSEPYFETNAADPQSQITYSGGIFSVRSHSGHSMSNHPVVEVSWYGAESVSWGLRVLSAFGGDREIRREAELDRFASGRWIL